MISSTIATAEMWVGLCCWKMKFNQFLSLFPSLSLCARAHTHTHTRDRHNVTCTDIQVKKRRCNACTICHYLLSDKTCGSNKTCRNSINWMSLIFPLALSLTLLLYYCFIRRTSWKMFYSDITKGKLVGFTHIGHVSCLSSIFQYYETDFRLNVNKPAPANVLWK